MEWWSSLECAYYLAHLTAVLFVFSVFHMKKYPNCCYCNSRCPKDLPLSNQTKWKHFTTVLGRNFFYVLFAILLIPTSIIAFIIWISCNVYRICFTRANIVLSSSKTTIKNIAIIGAGASGLVTCKELRAYGHNVVVFDKAECIGGSFSRSYKCGEMTSSIHLTQFSDFEVTAADIDGDNDKAEMKMNRGTILTFLEFMNYLNRYCKHFNLYKCIKLGHEVNDIIKSDSDKFILQVNDKEYEEEFDHLVICTGIATHCRYPDIFSSEMKRSKFKFNVIHSSDLNDISEDEKHVVDKNVLVIGCGESGSDISWLVSNSKCKSCVVTTRNGPGFLIPRWFLGCPSDIDSSRDYGSCAKIKDWKITKFKVWLETFWMVPYDDENVLRHASKFNAMRRMGNRRMSPFSRFGCKSINVIRGLLYNPLKLKSNHSRIKNVGYDYIEYNDGNKYYCDTVICCTGYKTYLFPFLNNLAYNNENNQWSPNNLYAHMFDAEYGDKIAFIGYNRPFLGSLIPISELSARYYAQIVSNKKQLPDKQSMLKDIESEKRMQTEQFPNDYESIPDIVDFVKRSDKLAALTGCDLKFFDLWCKYPLVWLKVLAGPMSYRQFRIYGPNSLTIQQIKQHFNQNPINPFPVVLVVLFMYIWC